MTIADIKDLLTIVFTAANSIGLILLAIRRLAPEMLKIRKETEKIESEEDNEVAETSKVTIEGAKISTEMLMQRIEELKDDLEKEKIARKEDTAYLRRRLRDSERESRDYRAWAAGLVKQVILAGQIPVPFIPSTGDSDPTINESIVDEAKKRSR